MAIIMQGKELSNKILDEFSKKINDIISKGNRSPHLVIYLIGNDGASKIYVRHKMIICEKLNIKVTLRQFINIDEKSLLAILQKDNLNEKIDAILFQLPLPLNLDKIKILSNISVQKDVDGLHYINGGKLFHSLQDVTIPCTAKAVIELLKAYNIDVLHKTIAIIGTSNLVGKPLAMLLHNLGATIILCNKNTINFKKYTLISDIVISAAGVCKLIDVDSVKFNSVIIDIGINRDEKTNKIMGDVDFDLVKEKVSYITPVPNGVGPMTIAMLISNIYDLYFKKFKNKK